MLIVDCCVLGDWWKSSHILNWEGRHTHTLIGGVSSLWWGWHHQRKWPEQLVSPDHSCLQACGRSICCRGLHTTTHVEMQHAHYGLGALRPSAPGPSAPHVSVCVHRGYHILIGRQDPAGHSLQCCHLLHSTGQYMERDHSTRHSRVRCSWSQFGRHHLPFGWGGKWHGLLYKTISPHSVLRHGHTEVSYQVLHAAFCRMHACHRP